MREEKSGADDVPVRDREQETVGPNQLKVFDKIILHAKTPAELLKSLSMPRLQTDEKSKDGRCRGWRPFL